MVLCDDVRNGETSHRVLLLKKAAVVLNIMVTCFAGAYINIISGK